MAKACEQVETPLHVDLVLEQLFRHLPSEDLLVCRSVCHQWCQISAKYIHRAQSRQVCLYNSDQLYSFLSVYLQSETPEIWTCVELDVTDIAPVDSQLLIHIMRSQLKQIRILPGNRICLVRIFQFLRCLKDLEVLEFEVKRAMIDTNRSSQSNRLYLTHNFDINRLQEFQDWLATQPVIIFPKVKSLKIGIQIESEFPETSKEFFSSLFKMLPHLSVLKISNRDRTVSNATKTGTMQAFEESSILPELVSLRIDNLEEENLQKIIEFQHNGMNLKRLELLLLEGIASTATLKNILENLADTLEELSLGGYDYTFAVTIFLKLNQIFPKLQILNFYAGITIDQRLNHVEPIILDINYEKQLPAIQSLGLFNFTDHRLNDFRPKQPFICRSLAKIICFGECEAIGRHNLISLRNSFVNVTDLTVSIEDKETMLEIFENWNKLQMLHLVLVERIGCIDEIFTGIPIEDNNSMELKSPFDVDIGECVFQEIQCNSTGRASLADLKDLKMFKLEFNFRHTLGPVKSRFLPSDLTGMIVLRQLKNLRQIFIKRSDMTNNCVRILREELELQRCRIGDKNGKLIDVHCETVPDQSY